MLSLHPKYYTINPIYPHIKLQPRSQKQRRDAFPRNALMRRPRPAVEGAAPAVALRPSAARPRAGFLSGAPARISAIRETRRQGTTPGTPGRSGGVGLRPGRQQY